MIGGFARWTAMGDRRIGEINGNVADRRKSPIIGLGITTGISSNGFELRS